MKLKAIQIKKFLIIGDKMIDNLIFLEESDIYSELFKSLRGIHKQNIALIVIHFDMEHHKTSFNLTKVVGLEIDY
jgi:hypothetical protein